MVSNYFDKTTTRGVTTPKRLFEKIEGAFDWNGAIYGKLAGMSGVYIIAVRKMDWLLHYPFGDSNVIYIGESKNIGERLSQHKFEGKNHELQRYTNGYSLNVYYRRVQDTSKLKLYEGQMILQFENRYGGIPMCNNQTPDFN